MLLLLLCVRFRSKQIKVLSLDGGSPKKKPRPANPFIDPPPPRHANQNDAQLFERVFNLCVEISNTEDLNPEVLLGQCNVGALEFLKTHFTAGQAHHMVKINDASELLPYIRELNVVKDMIKVAFDKYQKVMASALWRIGCNQDGVFKIDTLVGVINGVIVAKNLQAQQGNQNRAGNVGLGN